MGELDETFIWDVLAVTVKFARVFSVVPKLMGLVPESVVVPEPKLTVQELALLVAKDAVVTAYPAKSSEPFVTMIPDGVAALPKDQPQSTPLTAKEKLCAIPFVVSVLPVVDPVSVIVPL